MAHHQHHGPDYEAQLSRSLSIRPTSPHATSMPSISEDEQYAETDEPPDPHRAPRFTKNTYPSLMRRQSLLTRALHTDSESHDEDHDQGHYFTKLPSVSSTCSNPSIRSNGDFTSDDGHVSPSTRPSTPGSPRSSTSAPKHSLPLRDYTLRASIDSIDQPKAEPTSPPKDPVEATLGRRRCIMFACGRKDAPASTPAPAPASAAASKPEPILAKPTEEKPAPKRTCSIKFVCPLKTDKPKESEAHKARVHSPAPTKVPTALHRRHRDSDTTIREESPTTPRAFMPNPSQRRYRRFSQHSDLGRTEACRFHAFASETEVQEDWTQESTCHKTRLTVDDTLKKEHDIRRLAEEADEEEALEHEMEDNDYDSSDEDDLSDEGFHSDDEEGFAESDDDEDDDYEWWAPRKTRALSPYVGRDVFRPVSTRTFSNSSVESDDGHISPRSRGRHGNKRTRPLSIRPGTPELPDSTDFVCGTLDEDRPMEAAYMSCVAQRRAAKHRVVPQDIDPSFPLSDPEIGSDDDDDAPVAAADDAEESDHFVHGRLENIDEDEEPRGRRLTIDPPKASPPRDSPLRLRSPPPPAKKSCAAHRSPAPVGLFNRASPRRMRSPAPGIRMTSPPNSRRGSGAESSTSPVKVGLPFLSMRTENLTHTASLPRSPHPFIRRRPSTSIPLAPVDDEDDDGSLTDRPNDGRYTRGAIDIAQGLERKRLKRREKFYQKYARKEEKRERKGRTRPQPGKGAQRMRQIGLECAVYRGKRMLSI